MVRSHHTILALQPFQFNNIQLFAVPNTIDGRFKIENSDFMDEYKDHDSPIYHEIVSDIESGIMESLQSFNNVHVKVFNLS